MSEPMIDVTRYTYRVTWSVDTSSADSVTHPEPPGRAHPRRRRARRPETEVRGDLPRGLVVREMVAHGF